MSNPVCGSGSVFTNGTCSPVSNSTDCGSGYYHSDGECISVWALAMRWVLPGILLLVIPVLLCCWLRLRRRRRRAVAYQRPDLNIGRAGSPPAYTGHGPGHEMYDMTDRSAFEPPAYHTLEPPAPIYDSGKGAV